MLFHRDGFESGILKNGEFVIYKDKVINGGKELKHEDKSYDIQEAVVQCINKDCQGFVRSTTDGNTSYYQLVSQCYDGEDDYMKSPEEQDSFVIQDFQNKEKADDATKSLANLPSTTAGSKLTTPTPIESVQDKPKSEFENFIFYFILCILVAVVTWTFVKRTEPYKSPFSSDNVNLSNEP